MDADLAGEVVVGSGPGRPAEVRIFGKFGAGFSQDSMFEVFEQGYEGGVHVGI